MAILSKPHPRPSTPPAPDLNQIFIGSEGTLGVMTKAQIRIYEQPEERRFRGFLFKDMTGAFQAARELLQKFKPSVMRLYDPAETATLIKKIVGVERDGAFMNVAIEGVSEMVALEEKILLDTFAKYGAEDMGSEYGEKWWKEKITFFYPGNMMDLPQMFGTMDTIAPYDKIEKIYWAMKEAVETNFPQARFIAHFSHWYEWGCMVYDRSLWIIRRRIRMRRCACTMRFGAAGCARRWPTAGWSTITTAWASSSAGL